MNDQLVVDASVVIKWFYEEDDSAEALQIRERYQFVAPDLLVAECANIVWKKVQRGELSSEEALLSVKLLANTDVELCPMMPLIEQASALSLELRHPAYDCFYLALAVSRETAFVTADARLANVVAQRGPRSLASRCRLLKPAG